MIGIGSLLKLAKGGLGPDELSEILAAAGMELQVQPVPMELESFRVLAETASLPGAKLVRLQGGKKSGDRIDALLVITQNRDGGHKKIEV
jgi:hypothetical protein